MKDVCGSSTHLTTKFCVNLSCSFCIILLTIQPTSKQTKAKTKWEFMFIPYLCSQVPQFSFATTPPATCELITVSLCQDLPYADTAMPNILGHKSQGEAGLEVHQYAPLIKVGCSSHLKPFLCSVYTPECTSGKRRPPCKTLCEQARAGCESLMNKFGFQWPDTLSCDKFSTESCEHVSLLLFFPLSPITSSVMKTQNLGRHAQFSTLYWHAGTVVGNYFS